MFNWTEFGNKVTGLAADIRAIISFSKEYVSVTPKDVSISIYDDAGVVQTHSFWNIAKQLESVPTTIRNENDKTIYVDEINGLDTNAGTATSPMQNIAVAVGKVQNGGRITVVLLSDCTFTQNVYINNAKIRIELNGHTFNIKEYLAYGTTYGVFGITGSNNTVEFVGQDIVNALGQNTINLPNIGLVSVDTHQGAFLKGDYMTKNNALSIIYGVNVNDYGVFYLLTAELSTASFGIHNLYLFPSTNRVVADLVAGIARDANGTPRNVQSNLIL